MKSTVSKQLPFYVTPALPSILFSKGIGGPAVFAQIQIGAADRSHDLIEYLAAAANEFSPAVMLLLRLLQESDVGLALTTEDKNTIARLMAYKKRGII